MRSWNTSVSWRSGIAPARAYSGRSRRSSLRGPRSSRTSSNLRTCKSREKGPLSRFGPQPSTQMSRRYRRLICVDGWGPNLDNGPFSRDLHVLKFELVRELRGPRNEDLRLLPEYARAGAIPDRQLTLVFHDRMRFQLSDDDLDGVDRLGRLLH